MSKRPHNNGNGAPAKKARPATVASQIATAMNKESKFFDTAVDLSTATAGTVVASMNLIPQGTGEAERVGRKCTLRSINYRYTMTLNTTGTIANTSATVRVIVFHDKQANGATATVTNILESAAFLSFNNLANKNRFRTLHDKIYSLESHAGAGNGTSDGFAEATTFGSAFIKCNIPLEFDSTAGAITELKSSNIGILWIVSQNLVTVVGTVRVRYTDM